MTLYKRAYPCVRCGSNAIYDTHSKTISCKCGIKNAPKPPSDLAVMWDQVIIKKKEEKR